jgi:hypothetical protein
MSEEMGGIGTALGNARGLSLLQDAEKRRAEREHSLFLDVPTWGGDLVCEYRVVAPEALRRIVESAVRNVRNGNTDEPSANDVRLIIAAAVGLYAKDPETGERVPIEDEQGHVGYNRIAYMLGKEDELKSNADVVRYLMSERNEDGTWTENITAISIHANAISNWMRDPSKRGVDLDDLMGEF